MNNCLGQEGVSIHLQAAMGRGAGETGRSAEDRVSKNLQTRSQVDADSSNGLFDTSAGPMTKMSRSLNKRAHFLEHLRGLDAAGWGGSGRWPAMRHRGHGRARPPRLPDTLTPSRTHSTLAPRHRQRSFCSGQQEETTMTRSIVGLVVILALGLLGGGGPPPHRRSACPCSACS